MYLNNLTYCLIYQPQLPFLKLHSNKKSYLRSKEVTINNKKLPTQRMLVSEQPKSE